MEAGLVSAATAKSTPPAAIDATREERQKDQATGFSMVHGKLEGNASGGASTTDHLIWVFRSSLTAHSPFDL